MGELDGKVAIVTGASSGIGEAIAVRLAGAGCKVAGLARRVDKIQQLSSSLGEGQVVFGIKCDVSSEEDVKNAFTSVEKHLGPPHILINNAGLLKQSVLTDFKTRDVQSMFNVNVVGLAMCAREAVSLMMKNGIHGTIININSTAGHEVIPIPGIAAYNATKFAVTALTEALRNEMSLMRTNIRVASLSPGLVESEMSDQFKMATTTDTPILKADDIAECVLYILKAPQHVNVTELSVCHVNESSSTIALSLADILGKSE